MTKRVTKLGVDGEPVSCLVASSSASKPRVWDSVFVRFEDPKDEARYADPRSHLFGVKGRWFYRWAWDSIRTL